MSNLSKTLIIGHGLEGFTASRLLSPINVDEFDVVIWETSFLSHEAPKRENQYLPVQNQVGAQFIDALKGKVAQLETWVSAGHTLVVVLDQPLLQFDFGLRNNPNLSTQFDTQNLSILHKGKLERRNGTRLKPTEKNNKSPLANWLDKLEYHYIVGCEDRRDILLVDTALPQTTQAVASIVLSGKGQIIFVPTLQEAKLKASYFGNLSKLHELLNPPKPTLPEWVENFGSPDESDLKAGMAERVAQIDVLQTEINQFSEQLQSFYWLKILVAGSGDEFLDAVKKGLEHIGFQAAKVSGKRIDLIAKDDNRLFACETKGVDRAGKEEDLRQTNSWVSDVALAVVAEDELLVDDPHIEQCVKALAELKVETGTDAGKKFVVKGLMVLATFRKIPLGEKPADDFPADMLLNVARSGVCALSGHQLANLVLFCMKKPDERANVRMKIFETNGTFLMGEIPDVFKRI